MRVLLALDKFKGTFSAREASESIAAGIQHRNPKIDVATLPMADGGEGTAQIIAEKIGADVRSVCLPGLSASAINTPLFWHNERRIAILESATVLGANNGLAEEKFLLQSSSAPLGHLIQKALELRPNEIWIGVGGTLTADAGWGAASVLGLDALDSQENILTPCIANMDKIASFRIHPQNFDVLKRTRMVALCDVNAPAAPVSAVSLASFLPQKGASPSSVASIEKNIMNFSAKLSAANSNILSPTHAYTGAGGGLCIGLSAISQNFATEAGAHTVARINALTSHLAGSNVVVCGEGQLDEQTLFGKTPLIVTQLAHKARVPVWGVFGSSAVQNDAIQKQMGLQNLSVLFYQKPHSHSELVRQSRVRLQEVGVAIAHWLETTLV